jgi:hypothetical protein
MSHILWNIIYIYIMKLTNLTSQQLRNVKTYADFGSKDLTIIVDSNNLINFNLLAIISGNISSKCHTTHHHYNLLTNKPHKFEATYLLYTSVSSGTKLNIYHTGTGFGTDGSGVPVTLPWGGDGFATTTEFTPSESTGTQLSCNCLKPRQLGEDLAALGWVLTAPAESMAGPYVTGYNCGTGKTAQQAETNTASAPCLSCFELTAIDHVPSWGPQPGPPAHPLKVIVGDACPHRDNKKICPQYPGEQNDLGGCCGNNTSAYNHFDLWLMDTTLMPIMPITDRYPKWTKLSTDWNNGQGNWPANFIPIPCDKTVLKVMNQHNCTPCSQK